MSDLLRRAAASVVVRVLSSIFAGFALAVATANSLWANWSWDVILVRSYGPLFPDVHALSVGSVVVAAYVMCWRKKSLVKGVLLGFSIVPVHDFIWAGGELVISGSEHDLGLTYAVMYAALLAGTLYVASRRERTTIGLSALPMLAIFLIGLVFNLGGTIVSGQGGTLKFDNPISNIGEIAGWATGALVWISRK